MFKTTEELKLETFRLLNLTKKMCLEGVVPEQTLTDFGLAFEAYLARLDNEAKSNAARLEETQKWSSICSDAYTHQQQLTHAACVSERETWSENHELKSRIRELEATNSQAEESREELKRMTDLRHCYERLACDYTKKSVELTEERDALRNRLQALEHANLACGDQLRTAHDLIKRQRGIISDLYRTKETFEVVPGTSAQSSDEKAIGEVLGAIQMPCQHSWRRLVAYPSGKDHQECIFCLKIEEA